jgi:hypothetical protein
VLVALAWLVVVALAWLVVAAMSAAAARQATSAPRTVRVRPRYSERVVCWSVPVIASPFDWLERLSS